MIVTILLWLYRPLDSSRPLPTSVWLSGLCGQTIHLFSRKMKERVTLKLDNLNLQCLVTYRNP